MSQATYANKREHLLALIKEGTYTREQLLEKVECTSKSMGTLFTYLRMMGHFPMKAEDGTYYLGTQEAYEAQRAEAKTKAPTKVLTQEERIEAAQKREHRAAGALTKATERFEKDGSRENELRLAVAQAEMELATYLVYKAEQNEPMEEAEVEETAAVEPESAPW